MKSFSIQPYLTRKFLAASLTAGLLVGCWVASNWLKVAGQNFGALAGALVGALTAFCASNVAQDAILGNNSDTTNNVVVVNPPQPTKP